MYAQTLTGDRDRAHGRRPDIYREMYKNGGAGSDEESESSSDVDVPLAGMPL